MYRAFNLRQKEELQEVVNLNLTDLWRSLSINSWHVDVALSRTNLLQNTIFIKNHLFDQSS